MSNLDDPVYLNALSGWSTYYSLRCERHYGSWPRKSPPQAPGFSRFLELGKICYEHSWCIGDYIAYLFKTLPNPAEITPKQLVAEKNVQRFAVACALDSTPEAERDWTMSEVTLRGIVGATKRFRDPEDALLNLDISFPVWFRCLYPWPPLESVYQVFGTAAYAALLQNPRLRRDLSRRLCPLQLTEMQRRYGAFPPVEVSA